MFQVHVTNGGSGGVLFHGTATMLQCEVDSAEGTGVTSNSGTATIERSWIHDNGNTGVDLRGSGQIVNSIVSDNGGTGIVLEGMIVVGDADRAVLDDRAGNGAATGTGGVGIECKTPAAIDSSIVSGNGDPPEMSSICSATYSLFGDATPAPGAGNLTDTDPMFVDDQNDDFHLQDGSPAIDHANPAATVTVDYDGTMRPRGSGFDIGSYEH